MTDAPQASDTTVSGPLPDEALADGPAPDATDPPDATEYALEIVDGDADLDESELLEAAEKFDFPQFVRRARGHSEMTDLLRERSLSEWDADGKGLKTLTEYHNEVAGDIVRDTPDVFVAKLPDFMPMQDTDAPTPGELLAVMRGFDVWTGYTYEAITRGLQHDADPDADLEASPELTDGDNRPGQYL